jgi:hypothetical protein
MRRKAAAIGLALLLAATAGAGCGEGRAKRAVDARTEVLEFYGVDAPVVAVLRPLPSADVLALDRAASGRPAWDDLRADVAGPLQAAGLGPRQLARLVEPREEIEGVDAAALALGAPTPEDLAAKRPLLVLTTDQDELLARLFARAAGQGLLQPAGRLDDAQLYRSPSDAFAVRDGVLVSAHTLGEVRTAIERRDGDSDLQLDNDVVHSIFNDFDPQGPLLVYANVPRIAAEPEVRNHISDRAVLESGEDAAASVRAVADSIEVDVVVRLGQEPGPSETTLTETPQPLRLLAPGLGALSGVGSLSGDQVRLHLKAGG